MVRVVHAGERPAPVIADVTALKKLGQFTLTPDDVKAVAVPVLRHRLVLRPEADLEGVTTDHVVNDIVAAVEVPK